MGFPRRKGALAAGAAAVVAVGCDLGSAGLESGDGGGEDATVVGGADAQPGTDGAAHGGGDATVLGDAHAPDASSPDDASPPPLDAADAGPTPFCAAHPGYTFCTDFDEPGTLQDLFCNGAPTGSFCTVAATGDASVTLDDSIAFSPPGSMSATTNPVPSNSAAQAYGGRALPPRPGGVHLGLELRVDAVGAGVALPIDVVLGDFVPGATNTAHAVYAFAVVDDGGPMFSLFLQEVTAGTYGTAVLVASGLSTATWYRVALSVDDGADAAVRGASLAVDDVDASIVLSGATVDASTRAVTIGAPIVLNASSSWTIHVDDVIAFAH